MNWTDFLSMRATQRGDRMRRKIAARAARDLARDRVKRIGLHMAQAARRDGSFEPVLLVNADGLAVFH